VGGHSRFPIRRGTRDSRAEADCGVTFDERRSELLSEETTRNTGTLEVFWNSKTLFNSGTLEQEYTRRAPRARLRVRTTVRTTSTVALLRTPYCMQYPVPIFK
jgi:hypothetical protein